MNLAEVVRTARQNLAYVVFRLGAGIFGTLPVRTAQWLGEVGGRIVYRFAAGRREMAVRHARRLGSDDPETHARRVFEAYGRYWAEVFWVRPRRIGEIVSRIEVEGIEHVRQAKADGKGMVFAVPHLGNWEIAGPIGVEEELNLVAVAEDLANRRIRDWFIQLRNRLGIGVILIGRNGASVIRSLEKVIASNGAVALLCDRDLRGRGVRVVFFGEETTMPAGPVRLALRSGAPLLPVAVYFKPGSGHRIVVRPPLEVRDGETEDALRRGAQKVAEALEELIIQAPEQWHLLQPNWPSDRE